MSRVDISPEQRAAEAAGPAIAAIRAVVSRRRDGLCPVNDCGVPRRVLTTGRVRAYCAMHFLESVAAYRARNRERLNEYNRAWALAHSRRRVIRPIEDRFWEKVEKTPTCWLWIGSRDPNGYGGIYWNGRLRPAHQVSFILAGGEIPEDLQAVTHRVNALRGVSPAAKHALQTHCINGHPFDEANTYHRRDVRGRMCRRCHADSVRRGAR